MDTFPPRELGKPLRNSENRVSEGHQSELIDEERSGGGGGAEEEPLCRNAGLAYSV